MDVEMREMDGLSGTRQIKEELPTIRLLVLSSLDIFFSSRRPHTRDWRGWSSDVCSSDLRRSCPRCDVLNLGRAKIVGVAHRIALLPGDGVGPEVIAEARKVVDALALDLEWTELPWGSAY